MSSRNNGLNAEQIIHVSLVELFVMAIALNNIVQFSISLIN